MRIFLFVLALAFGLFGAVILSRSEGAIHEIEALICFLIGAVFLSGAGIIDAVLQARPKVETEPGPRREPEGVPPRRQSVR